MFGDDAMADRQSQAGPLAGRLCGEERVEDLAEHIRRHAAAGVLEFQFDVIGELRQSGFPSVRRRPLETSEDSETSEVFETSEVLATAVDGPESRGRRSTWRDASSIASSALATRFSTTCLISLPLISNTQDSVRSKTNFALAILAHRTDQLKPLRG